jgi:predicted transcriptional regulator
LNSTVSLYESESLLFRVEAYDIEDGTDLNYNWYLNYVLFDNQNKEYYKFTTDYHGNLSAGNYSLKVVISDLGIPPKSVEFEWSIEVLERLSDLAIFEDEIEITSNNVTVNENIEFDILIHNLQPALEFNVTVHLYQQSTNASIGEEIYSKFFIDKFYGNSKEILTISWVANTSYQYLKIWVDPNHQIPEIVEDNNFAIIPINVSQPPKIPPPPKTNDDIDEQGLNIYHLVAAGTICTILSLFLAISTEVGNYKLYLMLSPFYSRVTGDKVLEHRVRSKIYSYIRAHPGDHYRSIMAKLKIKNGTLVHHLSRLEQEELIKSERDGYFKRFYPVGQRIPRSEVGMYYPEGMATYNIGEHQVSAIQLRIIKIIINSPGLTQKEIAQKIRESRRVVNYHVKLLEQHELIKIIKNGRETQCYIADKYAEYSKWL